MFFVFILVYDFFFVLDAKGKVIVIATKVLLSYFFALFVLELKKPHRRAQQGLTAEPNKASKILKNHTTLKHAGNYTTQTNGLTNSLGHLTWSGSENISTESVHFAFWAFTNKCIIDGCLMLVGCESNNLKIWLNALPNFSHLKSRQTLLFYLLIVPHTLGSRWSAIVLLLSMSTGPSKVRKKEIHRNLENMYAKCVTLGLTFFNTPPHSFSSEA